MARSSKRITLTPAYQPPAPGPGEGRQNLCGTGYGGDRRQKGEGVLRVRRAPGEAPEGAGLPQLQGRGTGRYQVAPQHLPGGGAGPGHGVLYHHAGEVLQGALAGLAGGGQQALQQGARYGGQAPGQLPRPAPRLRVCQSISQAAAVGR